jgi:archaellum component FlaC
MTFFFSSLKYIITGATALLSTVGVVAGIRYVAFYFNNRNKNNASAKKTNSEAGKIEWDGWKGYAEKLEARMDVLESRYESKIKELEILIGSKDEEIRVLTNKVSEQAEQIRILNHQVGNLEQVNVTNDETRSLGG